ncbi:MAG: SGNH/GDSL hydrolase family protein [Ferruginibacter sp.]
MENRLQKIVVVLAIFFHAAVFAQTGGAKFVSFADKHISYMGRIGVNDTCAEIYWTGSSIKLNVKDTKTVKALLGNEAGNDWYYVIVDGNNPVKINIEKEKKLYTLAANLNAGKHAVELFKITNTDFITARFYGFELDGAARILAPQKKSKRKIEFFGNSITCGHGVDTPKDSADNGRPENFNNYLAYGAITARHFNAQYHCTSKSGIGITISWFKEIMPDIYDRLNPADTSSKWVFEQYTPGIVVVNLFQNDSWLVNNPSHEQFISRFGTVKPSEAFIINSYAKFIKSLRGRYPQANIICCLGNMDATKEGSKWPGYIDAAVAILQDKKIVTHFFPYKNANGHPRVKEQQEMADDLIAFIAGKYWK